MFEEYNDLIGTKEKLLHDAVNLYMDKILRILILEDVATDADLIEFELHEAGIAFTSQRVVTERDYLQSLHDFSPDLILSDYDLPQYTGTLALDAAKRLCPEVPFILVTGAVDIYDSIFNEILVQGAKECVFKNQLELLPSAVRKVLMSHDGNGNANPGGVIN